MENQSVNLWHSDMVKQNLIETFDDPQMFRGKKKIIFEAALLGSV